MFTSETAVNAYLLLADATREAKSAQADAERVAARMEQAQMNLKSILDFIAENTPEGMPVVNLPGEFVTLDNEILQVARNGMDNEVGVTRRHIRRILFRKNKLWDTPLIQRRLEHLQAAGSLEYIVIPQPGGRPGRPLERYIAK